MEDNVEFWRELLQDGDCDDKFEGFTVKEVAESKLRCAKTDADLELIYAWIPHHVIIVN